MFTTLPPGAMEGRAILELYRFRWQIELAFKRMKGIVLLDEMTAGEPALCRAFLLMQVLALSLLDDLRCRWAAFSPGAMELQRPVCLWRLYRALLQTLRGAVGLCVRAHRWEAQPARNLRLFRDPPRQRVKQSARALNGMSSILAPPALS